MVSSGIIGFKELIMKYIIKGQPGGISAFKSIEAHQKLADEDWAIIEVCNSLEQARAMLESLRSDWEYRIDYA